MMPLVLPTIVSAVLVFIVSSVIHVVLHYHDNDFSRLPDEDGVRDALRPFNLPPGDYHAPRPDSPQGMKDPAFLERLATGPVFMMTVFPSGPINMTRSLLLWFVYCLVVGVFAAYVAMHAVAPGASYLEVFRYVGTVAFAGYGLALAQGSIWYQRKWSATFRSMFDALIYALLSAGTFGWMWPD